MYVRFPVGAWSNYFSWAIKPIFLDSSFSLLVLQRVIDAESVTSGGSHTPRPIYYTDTDTTTPIQFFSPDSIRSLRSRIATVRRVLFCNQVMSYLTNSPTSGCLSLKYPVK
jgi:hypothetical protein